MKKYFLTIMILSYFESFAQSITISPTVDEFKISTYGTNSPSIIGLSAAGTSAIPTATALGSSLLTLSGKGHTGSGFITSGSVGITFNTSQLFTPSGFFPPALMAGFTPPIR